MKLFEKKSKKSSGSTTEILHLNLDDFPEEALKLTYMDMMERYTDNPSSRLQKIMVQISRELNKRANTNNGETQVEISVSKEEPPKTNLEQLTEKRVDQMVERKPKKQSIFTKPISEVIKKKEPPKKISYNLNEDEQKRVAELKAYKKKKSFGSYFKKKVPVFKPSTVTIAEEIQNHPNIQQEANKIRKIEEELDSYEKEYGSVDKPAPQQVQIEKPKKKFSIPFGKKKGYNLKGIELICECGHYLKSHQKGGESIGCQRCGCLKTIEEIAERQGIKLKLKDQSQVVQQVMEKQVQQIQTMTTQKKSTLSSPPPPPTVLSPPTEKVDQIDHGCTCDHTESEHYEGKFCYNCNCSKFTPYPQDKHTKTTEPTEKTE